MAGFGNSDKTNQKRPKVTFSIESRKATPVQLEAGKRLFSRLLARAQSSIQNESKEVDAKT